MKNFFKSPWLMIACLFAYVGMVGPALMSAPSDLAVVLNLAIGVLLLVWFYRTFKRLAENVNHNDKE